MAAAEDESFTAEEKAAMKERSKELKTAARRRASGTKVDPLVDLLAKIDEMPEPDRAIAMRVHEIVTESAPDLTPKTWYGMPGWALDGTVVIFFQGATKFKTRYCTLGFSDSARLDDGPLWPTSYALAELTPDVERTVAALVTRAVAR
ncbi:hypothetical protein C5B96_00380 [Subtercola sp. Z020]|uniref:iron chaperone n=1 Tax=Subtercola sp. Z020 TaxID=2080582 RepID=UPI000CE8F5D4|nr:DUF1801 domain-containing protein [Subtercola sp. Z020]PPF90033.1 hypothetical protein C5B96_00380 [Subtercola sp. Z020]